MKLFLSAALLAIASAQVAPARLRSTNLPATVDAADSEMWGAGEDFGRLDEITAFRMLLSDMSLSMSMSMSMGVPTPAPFISTTDLPTPEPSYLPTTKTDAPTTETPAPSLYSTQAPTMSKSGKVQKQELFAYSWSIPSEYTGYFEIYEGHGLGPQAMHTNLELIDVVELGTGTVGANSVFLPRDEYTIIVVNQNKTVGFCCNGTQPGWIHFTWGGLEFDKVTGMYQEKKNREEFVAEFHKNPGKVEIGNDGAYFKFEARL